VLSPLPSYLPKLSIRFALALEESDTAMAFPTVLAPGRSDFERTLSLCRLVNFFLGVSPVHPNMKKREQKMAIIHRMRELPFRYKAFLQ
jgi:hypothetical protein